MRRNPTRLRLDQILKFRRCRTSLAHVNSAIRRQILLVTDLNRAGAAK